MHNQYLIQKFKLSYPLWFLKSSQLLLTQGFNSFKWIKPIQFINLNINELWVLTPVERAARQNKRRKDPGVRQARGGILNSAFYQLHDSEQAI